MLLNVNDARLSGDPPLANWAESDASAGTQVGVNADLKAGCPGEQCKLAIWGGL